MNRVHVVVNPLSAGGRTEKHWSTIRDLLKQTFREFHYIFTEKPRQATEIAREALRQGYDLIIGVGGDGTINELANGFFCRDKGTIINERASLGVIPSGTGSDFIRHLRIPRDFRRSVEYLQRTAPRLIDVGRMEYTDHAGRPTAHCFINVADFGLGAEVVRRMAAVATERRGALAYYRGLLAAVARYCSPRFTISCDGAAPLQGRFLIGAVANGRIFGGGMRIAPRAELDDGMFDLVLVEDMNPAAIVWRSPRLYSGTVDRHPKVRTLRVRAIEVQADHPCGLEYDGEFAGSLPARFTIMERALPIRV